jgi:hypothetical protein
MNQNFNDEFGESTHLDQDIYLSVTLNGREGRKEPPDCRFGLLTNIENKEFKKKERKKRNLKKRQG